MTLTKGTRVHYRDRANHRRTGTIDLISRTLIPGTTLYRINGKYWLPKEGLRAA